MAGDKLDFPSKTEAFHDEDGMYKMREPEPGDAGPEGMAEIQTDEGFKLYAPTPKFKQARILWVSVQGGMFQYECEESYEQLKDMLASAARNENPFYTVTDPKFGFAVEIPCTALAHPVAIVTTMIDIEAIKDQQDAYEMQKRLDRLQRANKGASKQQLADIVRRHN
jgi:hypothetical protein